MWRFSEKNQSEEIRKNWGRWRKNNIYYSNTVEWWVNAAKQQIRRLFTGVGAEKR
jgi:hypothetical protein